MTIRLNHPTTLALTIALTLGLSACNDAQSKADATTANKNAPDKAQAIAFIQDAEAQMAQLSIEANRAEWIYSNFITEDTAALSAAVGEKVSAASVKFATEAAKYANVQLDPANARKLNILRSALVLPAPLDPAKNAELAQISSELNGLYGKGKYCFADGKCMTQPELSTLMAESRDPAKLLEAWKGWREIAKPMRPLFQREVELANEGAKDLGYANLSELWRSQYDMKPDEFSQELDRLWGQVKPLYESLHCYVRGELNNEYGDAIAPKTGPIPAHLLGNMWAQQWGNVYDLVAPNDADPGYDVTELLEQKGYDEQKMVKQAESFFTSLGFAPLPESFWSRSLFLQPKDRDVVCHASAWDLDNLDDIRIKMCIQKTAEDFTVIHHELGHNFYQRAYKQQPFLFKNSANDGFHEAIGDTIALSITPNYLKQIGLLEDVPDASKDIGLLLKQALDKIAFLPFGLMIDQWRWKVFSGEITPAQYNQAWWELREKYQGVKAPTDRSEADFDPGAKYHVPGNVPYTRYFLAHILQFQFHKALCETAGDKGPVHRCSIYGNQAAGEKLNKMLALGASQPWPVALKEVTGTEMMDASAVLDYFAPLKIWLDEQNKAANRQCGW
ncbi:M2 family metallopeptidase [Shewanella xiamenensis]|uniref:M2 family metallopeptidase n=1 Tax=Shewanella xiamenensis TaxID=332186 RepID=UPI0024A76B7A|nr:M2 family metallopeptidase [Shewanella xiamenensis]MDI5837154.1 M2 family metallopeptidase [Shewanella xiamenensis]MDI5841832.1 M2 family metallopeptidase [Shewanella xiamenensis]MDI5845386.1 M2 family metallopeptidase [Shewanella xiamenensis]MDI5853660.1 M2 family metallopeptidase [Shewanella xiamenensis]MDI5857684.1 M2 family metallopeptidase [Shewanella xiamenensis]